MENQNLVESVLVGDSEQAFDAFNTIIAEKLADALEVRKVQIASGIMEEKDPVAAVNKLKSNGEHEKAGKMAAMHGLPPNYGPHFGMRDTKNAAQQAFLKGYHSAKIPDPNYSEFNWKTGKFKEEVEQIDENKKALTDAHKARITDGMVAHYGKGKVSFNYDPRGGHTVTHEVAGLARTHSVSKTGGRIKVAPYPHVTTDESVENGGEQIDEVRTRGGPVGSLRMRRAAARRAAQVAAKKKPNNVAEEIEQIDEAQLSDAQKLAMMKDPHKAAVLSAMKRYQTVGGDINKLSAGHRTLVANYLAKSGGLDSASRSAAMAALKSQGTAKPTDIVEPKAGKNAPSKM